MQVVPTSCLNDIPNAQWARAFFELGGFNYFLVTENEFATISMKGIVSITLYGMLVIIPYYRLDDPTLIEFIRENIHDPSNLADFESALFIARGIVRGR